MRAPARVANLKLLQQQNAAAIAAQLPRGGAARHACADYDDIELFGHLKLTLQQSGFDGLYLAFRCDK
jgi:hypothetical protein